jgi:hypothetical protein
LMVFPREVMMLPMGMPRNEQRRPSGIRGFGY